MVNEVHLVEAHLVDEKRLVDEARLADEHFSSCMLSAPGNIRVDGWFLGPQFTIWKRLHQLARSNMLKVLGEGHSLLYEDTTALCVWM